MPLSATAAARVTVVEAAADLTREERNSVELVTAVQMIVAGQATRIVLGGFPWQSDQVAGISSTAAALGVRVIPTVAPGGGAVDVVVRRGQ
jgi:hypothetical protein